MSAQIIPFPRTRKTTREYPAPTLGEMTAAIHRQRAEQRMAHELQLQARRDLSAHGLCWRCCQPIEAKQLTAFLAGVGIADQILSHAHCEMGAAS